MMIDEPPCASGAAALEERAEIEKRRRQMLDEGRAKLYRNPPLSQAPAIIWVRSRYGAVNLWAMRLFGLA